MRVLGCHALAQDVQDYHQMFHYWRGILVHTVRTSIASFRRRASIILVGLTALCAACGDEALRPQASLPTQTASPTPAPEISPTIVPFGPHLFDCSSTNGNP